MLLNLPNDILLKIIYLQPILCSTISITFNNIINNNDKCIKYIVYKYYKHFNLFLIYDDLSLTTIKVFQIIKSISYFFHNNLSIYEKNYLCIFNNILPKSYIYTNTNNINDTNNTNDINDVNTFINFYILFYSLTTYQHNTLSIYINKSIISINYTLDISTYYKLYKYKLYSEKLSNLKNKYYLIINPNRYLDESINLLNIYVNKLNNL